MPPRITQESCRPRVSDRTMVGTVPSGSCLQSVRVERQVAAMKPTAISSHSTAPCLRRDDVSFGGMGKSIERTKDRRRGKPQPAPAHSLSMSFQLAIPGQVALQQSLPPLRQPPPILPQSGKAVESVPRTSRRPPHPGLDAEKTSRCPAREKCFSLTSPLIEPASDLHDGFGR
jgi:hypothetical protein